MSKPPFDPYAILGALERNYVDYVVIGGLACVLRGTDEITTGLDICTSFNADNLARLGQAVAELKRSGGRAVEITDDTISREPPLAVSTSAGELKIVGTPAGAPRGFVDLRRAATKEHLAHGLRPLVASAADLARMVAALDRADDLPRLTELRRIVELEVDREHALPQPPVAPAPPRRRQQSGRKLTR
jgi:hypothetical protein